VTDSTKAITNQNWLPNDMGTVTTGGSTLNGSATLTLFNDGTCGASSGAPLYTTTKTMTTGTSDTITSANTTAYTDSRTVSWQLVYKSNDPNVSGKTTCEVTTVSISN
jgi:hypothetical protein